MDPNKSWPTKFKSKRQRRTSQFHHDNKISSQEWWDESSTTAAVCAGNRASVVVRRDSPVVFATFIGIMFAFEKEFPVVEHGGD
jgi:hypothetical protein